VILSRTRRALSACGYPTAMPISTRSLHLEGLTSCDSKKGWHFPESVDCRTATEAIVSRGLLINPKHIGGRPESNLFGDGVEIPAFDGASRQAFPRSAVLLNSVKTQLPPVLLTARHPVSRFVSALLNKVVVGLRVDNGRLQRLLGERLMKWIHPSRSHAIGAGQIFSMANTLRHPWGPAAHAWRKDHLRELLHCSTKHGIPGGRVQPALAAPTAIIDNIVDGLSAISVAG